MAIAASDDGLCAWLDQGIDHERAGSFREIRLERIRAFIARLPPVPPPLTVAGTKGKGSTVRLAEAALLAAGRPVLAFTSPHVASVRERWRLDGVPAPAALLAEAAGRVERLRVAVGAELTWFERSFALACLLAGERPGLAFLCEVGLGGRLDCANTLDAAVVVLTHLSHDHRDVLGPTLGHIAREKLAVCRPGRPLVVAPQSAEGAAAIRAALPAGVPATWVEPPVRPFDLALPGVHQQGNAATALAAARILAGGLDEERARQGMAQARLAARCQLVAQGGRRLLVDGAHNGPSVAATLAVAEGLLRPGFVVVLGLASDKEVDEVLAAIPAGRAVRRCGYASQRARGEDQWPPLARSWPWHAGIAQALAAVPGDRDVCITGSFYLAGEALVQLGAAGELPG
jgi:dihydrofolate synthase/folylpolyglutamate synthase